MREIGEPLDIIDHSRAAVESLDGRKRRLLTRVPSFTFQRFDQTCFLAANVGSGAGVEDDLEVISGSEDFPAEESAPVCFLQTLVQNTTANRKPAAYINESQVASHDRSGKDNAYDQLHRNTYGA